MSTPVPLAIAEKKEDFELLHHVFNADPKRVKHYLYELPKDSESVILKKEKYKELYYSPSKRKVFTKRSWETTGISPLEAAAWCGDNFILKMLIKKLPQSKYPDAIKQLRGVLELKENSENGSYLAPYNALIKAYQSYIDQINKDRLNRILNAHDWKKLNEFWNQVWEKQRKLPTYGLQEFSSDKAFYPLPSFKEPPQRSCYYYDGSSIDLEQNWGDGYALCKGESYRLKQRGSESCGKKAELDAAAIQHLCTIRRAELKDIIQNLEILNKTMGILFLNAEKNQDFEEILFLCETYPHLQNTLLKRFNKYPIEQKEKTAFSLLLYTRKTIVSKETLLFIQRLFSKIKIHYESDYTKLETEFENTFNKELIYITMLSEIQDLFVCLIRVPPKTKSYVFTYKPDGFERRGELSLGAQKVIVNFGFERHVHPNFESLQSHYLSMTREEVETIRAKVYRNLHWHDLKTIAEFRESSVRALSDGQFGVLTAIRKKYSEKLEKMGGIEGVLFDFKEYLEREFLKNPPQYTGKHLPLFYDSMLLDKDGQPNQDAKPIFELYYLNHFHTAWRFLLNPNPWIDPNAPYAGRTPTEAGSVATHATISDEGRLNLAYLWLAASDTSITPIRDMTVSDMMELFTQEIAFINRGHNWDAIDTITEGPEKRQMTESMVKKYGKIVDDLKPDNPSCFSGVTQRLMQAVLGNPITESEETRALDHRISKEHALQFIIPQFKKYISNKNIPELKKLLNSFNKRYIEMALLSKEDEFLFNEFYNSLLSLLSRDIRAFIEEIKKIYGERLSFIECRVDTERYTCYEEYIRQLFTQNPYDMFFERLKAIVEGEIKSKEIKEIKETKESKETKELEDKSTHPFMLTWAGYKAELKQSRESKKGSTITVL